MIIEFDLSCVYDQVKAAYARLTPSMFIQVAKKSLGDGVETFSPEPTTAVKIVAHERQFRQLVDDLNLSFDLNIEPMVWYPKTIRTIDCTERSA